MSFRAFAIAALVAATVAAPTAEARIDPPVAQDLRGPDARLAPGVVQDLRSPDARDAGRTVAPPAAPANARARVADDADGGFPWLAAALAAALVGGGAGAARRRFRPATTA